MSSNRWSQLAGICSAQGIAYAGDEDEKGLERVLKIANIEIPKEKVEKKVIEKPVEKKDGNDLKAQLDEKGIKYHHKAGEKKLKQLLADAE